MSEPTRNVVEPTTLLPCDNLNESEGSGDAWADCITACVNLAARHDLDLSSALEEVERHNRVRGRYDVD